MRADSAVEGSLFIPRNWQLFEEFLPRSGTMNPKYID
jgi:hypothetical protein